jgi:hypothetical protein
MALDACTRLFHCEQLSATEMTRMTAVSPVRRSMRCLFSQASHRLQSHSTLLYQPGLILLPDEQSTRPETRKGPTFEASNSGALLLP